MAGRLPPTTLRPRRVAHDQYPPARECAACRHQTSLTAGTIFHKTRKPLTLWFQAIFEFVSHERGCNAMDLQLLLGLSRKVAWAWLHKLRECMDATGHRPLFGLVEVDETHIGASEKGVFGRDRRTKKMLIAGVMEVSANGSCGRVLLAPVDSAATEDLQVFVANTVAESSRVHTDGLSSYSGLEHAYTHQVEVIGDPETACKKLPHVHQEFSLFRRLILATCQGSIRRDYAWVYFCDFALRCNRRASGSRMLLVQRVLEAAVAQLPRLSHVAGRDHRRPLAAAR